MVSRVRRATPPKWPRDGEGRMKALSSADRRSIRVLSPRMLPPEIGLDGSTLRTATASPRSRIRCSPSTSMNVLFPAPGVPVMPTRRDSPVCRQHAVENLLGQFEIGIEVALDHRDGLRQLDAVRIQNAVDVFGGTQPPAFTMLTALEDADEHSVVPTARR